MTKAQALALVAALEARSVPCDCLLRFDGAGAEAWSVQLDPAHVFAGADLVALGNYCTTNGLILSAQFAALGIV